NDPAVRQAQADFDKLDRDYSAAQAAALCEFDGTCGTHHYGGGPAYQAKVKVANDLKAQRDAAKRKLDQARSDALKRQNLAQGNEQQSAKAQLDTKKAQLTQLQQLKSQEEARYLADSKNDRGLLAQLEALSKITGTNGTLKTAYLTLLLF